MVPIGEEMFNDYDYYKGDNLFDEPSSKQALH
jgi:hypothetical protein